LGVWLSLLPNPQQANFFQIENMSADITEMVPHLEEKRKIYVLRVIEIKKKLAKYSNDSVLNVGLGSLATSPQGTSIELLQSMPDLVFLLIKWKMLCSSKGTKTITSKQFYDLKNDLFGLQVYAAELSKSVFPFLALRTFIIPQAKWQSKNGEELFALVRQRAWFTADANKEYYETVFRRGTGISIQNFYKITFLIVCLAADKPEIIVINISDLVIKLSPGIGIDEIAAFIKLLSSTVSQLPSLFKNYQNDSCEAREYFQQSAFNLKPFILHDQSLQIVYNNLTKIALSNFVPERLKKLGRQDFKKKFGNTMEKYIEDLLVRTKTHYINEDKIAAIYTENKIKDTKITDFIVEDEGRIFIESKALEPNDFFTTCTDPVGLNSRLSESFIKAINQVQDCCSSIGKLPEFNSKACYGLVILHKDFFFSTGATIERDVDQNLSDKINSKYGNIPIPLKNIYYLSIFDFELLLTSLLATGKTLTQFLDQAIADDEKPETAKMLFSMHISEQFNGNIKNDMRLMEDLEFIAEEVSALLLANKKHWNGKCMKYYQEYNKLLNIIS
jgi:hypothetical protein